MGPSQAERQSRNVSDMPLPSQDGPRGAGKHGIGMLSIAATAKQGMDLLAQHWATWEEVALEHGHVADRSKWRLSLIPL